ncbi:hypothetical protein GCM10010140_10060 [Streptosporangium pseudovulgare]|uniref:Uncharacterized protein n=1 Tax=Streptosporangium pseudovulgare TaxID=35765 RepID=A0ABQ2QKT9_9ACTN|nr:hypothetical protein GCM10010140_10060 [Streptosporangium pseudovulgare]
MSYIGEFTAQRIKVDAELHQAVNSYSGSVLDKTEQYVLRCHSFGMLPGGFFGGQVEDSLGVLREKSFDRPAKDSASKHPAFSRSISAYRSVYMLSRNTAALC